MKTFARALILFLTITLGGYSFAEDQMDSSFVYLKDVDPSIRQDIRYATSRNFIGKPLPGYDAPECILAKPVAIALKRVQTLVKQHGFSLKVYDCYRPRRAVRAFVQWARKGKETDKTRLYYPLLAKNELFRRGYIARPSAHSRGVAVDLTLIKIPSPFITSTTNDKYHPCNAPVEKREPDNSVDMGTAWDCFDEKSHTWNNGISANQRKLREFLVMAMEREGFQNYKKEWWHFSLPLKNYKKFRDFIIEPHCRYWVCF